MQALKIDSPEVMMALWALALVLIAAALLRMQANQHRREMEEAKLRRRLSRAEAWAAVVAKSATINYRKVPMPIPAIGRQVLFHRTGHEGICLDAKQPMAAVIAFVHGPRSVNLTVFGHKGDVFPMDGVRLAEPGEQLETPYCEWPPEA